MCKKLSILCLMLVVVALGVPASAAPISVANPLLIDLNAKDYMANGTPYPADVNNQMNFYGWNFPFDGTKQNPSGQPFNLNMQPTHNATVTLGGVRADGVDALGVRGRYQATGQNLSKVYQDLFYIAQGGGTGTGLGKNYLKVDFTFTGMEPEATQLMTFSLFAWDCAFKGSGVSGYAGSGEQPLSKKAAWSLTNPATWIAANAPGGAYHPKVGDPNTVDSNMPAGLQALLLGSGKGNSNNCKLLLGPKVESMPVGDASASTYATTFTLNITANEAGIGTVTIYGWNDMTTWTGSQHMAINGIRVVPEPATVALLGLGGLLLRRRKHA
jgi:hypothetical protein